MAAGSTVGEALNWARGICQQLSETAYLDAQLLLSHAMEKPQSWLLAHSEARIPPQSEAAFRRAVERYRQGQALPYILGWWEFYGRRFQVSPEVLIPRPETELLVEVALEHLRGIGRSARVLDVGTGSGSIAISLAAESESATVVAVDISAGALRVAQKNARDHAVSDRVHLIQADLVATLTGRFDLICANLPYIPSERLQWLPVGGREPRLALDGGVQGMMTIRRLMANAPARTKSGGRILVEIGPDQRAEMMACLQDEAPGSRVRVHQDLAGLDRLIELEVKGQGT